MTDDLNESIKRWRDEAHANAREVAADLGNVIAFPPRQPRITTYEQATRFYGLGLVEAGKKTDDQDVINLGNSILALVPTAP
jgi:hypothetical protein